MSLTLADPVLARRRFFHAVAVQSQAALYLMSMQFFSWLMQQGGKPTMQVVEMDVLSDVDTVIADSPCNILAVLLHKNTATASFFKGTDSATASSDADSDLTQKIAGAANVMGLFYPKGFAMANGFTVQGNTTASGGTGSGVNGPDGVVLLRAA